MRPDAPDTCIVRAEGLVLSPFPDSMPFDFAVRRGEHWLLRGPTRSGKTPLLKTLCGLVSPAAGRVTLLGHDLEQLSPAELLRLRQRIGFVFALDGLLPAWSGFENLALPLKYHGRAGNGDIVDRVEAFAARYGVPEDWLNNPVGALSAEKRSALALIRALLIEPELLFVDGVALDALVAFSGIRGGELMTDAIAGRCTVVVSLPAGGAGRLPEVLGDATFRSAEMRDGRLECAD
jgi:predicted ABC-type transport system involved in lysophospholipase L1 biosynthesis ATPase subunit